MHTLSILQKLHGRTPTASPLSSPSKLGDRFIPTRAGANWNINFHRINVRTFCGKFMEFVCCQVIVWLKLITVSRKFVSFNQ